MQVVPGRKAVVVFSEGFDMFNDRLAGEEVWHSFIRLMNRANRAGVVVYTVDPRGLRPVALLLKTILNPRTSPRPAAFPWATQRHEAEEDDPGCA